MLLSEHCDADGEIENKNIKAFYDEILELSKVQLPIELLPAWYPTLSN